MPNHHDLRVESLDKLRHVRLTGDLDLTSVSLLESELEPLLKEHGNLTLDVAGVSFVDSSGMRSLIRASLRLGHGRLIILKPSAQVKRLFQITGIQRSERVAVHDADCCLARQSRRG